MRRSFRKDGARVSRRDGGESDFETESGGGGSSSTAVGLGRLWKIRGLSVDTKAGM